MKNKILTNRPNSPAEKAKRLMELQAIYKDIKPQIEQLKEVNKAAQEEYDKNYKND